MTTKATKSPDNCRHEFVRIYQRKLKGLERRLVATKAYLPVGFKQTDFTHLSEGSYCFCSQCRSRLYPRRTNAEKLQARLANQQAKLEALEALELQESLDLEERSEDVAAETDSASTTRVSVEELDVDAVGLEELGDSNVAISEEEEESI